MSCTTNQVAAGNMTWFCCGNAWGPCGSAGHGACGTCNPASHQCAWPNISDACVAITGPQDCGISLGRYGCGHGFYVVDKCNSSCVFVTVADCGPDNEQLLRQFTSCGSFGGRNRIVDLTASAWVGHRQPEQRDPPLHRPQLGGAMNELDRRQFLTRAALGSATAVSATALGPLVPLAQGADGPVIAPVNGLDPNFFEGRIVGIDGSTLVVTSDSYLIRRIQVTNGTEIWKLRDTTFDQIVVNDRLYARGVVTDSGDFVAQSVWVNIVNLHVEISSIRSDRLLLNHVNGPLVGHLVADTVAAYNVGPETRDLSRLRPGLHVQMIGAWHPDTNEIDIARIYAPI